jgi:hypothetical protein
MPVKCMTLQSQRAICRGKVCFSVHACCGYSLPQRCARIHEFLLDTCFKPKRYPKRKGSLILPHLEVMTDGIDVEVAVAQVGAFQHLERERGVKQLAALATSGASSCMLSCPSARGHLGFIHTMRAAPRSRLFRLLKNRCERSRHRCRRPHRGLGPAQPRPQGS